MPFTQQIDREPVLRLLRLGTMTETAIAKQLGISRPTVHKIRTQHGLPAPLRGSTPKHPSLEAAYHAHAQPSTDGHILWTGGRRGDTPVIQRRHTSHSVYRIAFRIRHGRNPEGRATLACNTPGCVAGAHLEDQAMRNARRQYEQAQRRRLPKGPAANGTRTDVLALIGQGMSNRQIGILLRTNPLRVARIRAEEGMPNVTRVVAPLDDCWRTHTRLVEGGHVEWTGQRREGAPVLTWQNRSHQARRIAFRMGHGREPEGRVKAGCNFPDCVAPDHMEDARLRALYAAVLGAVA
ncbi:hypothetical protein [Streptomyces antibioticus]|uniref:Uncharacterized protein n=1 Tax=Streptomyces antibioticus TaxID=1890 RepID=A0AAE6YDB3_STRAT|nr:hypothetical protein [Streptomyces antibioticus]QIT47593.1 hypothetical protein HCX60_32050 [Streptomyces antibioticus]